jgi:hypothetical protein
MCCVSGSSSSSSSSRSLLSTSSSAATLSFFNKPQALCPAAPLPAHSSPLNLAETMKRTAAAALLLVCLLAAAGAVSAQDSVAPQNFVPPPTTSATRFVATLRGNSAASAVMSLTVDTVAQTASYTFNMNNIPRYTMSHIHVVRALRGVCSYLCESWLLMSTKGLGWLRSGVVLWERSYATRQLLFLIQPEESAGCTHSSCCTRYVASMLCGSTAAQQF